MSSQISFRIIIVGGGIAGLTLAIMLEKFNIDYVLLEAHGQIAPPVGASIGLMPNGLLILDQIGCYDIVREVAHSEATSNAHVRSHRGNSLYCTKDMASHLEKRHGYPTLFFDRQWLLRILYNQAKHRDRICVNSRVHAIELNEKGVQVTTTNGQVHAGHIIIGADGIHSVVRQEMKHLAGDTNPGHFSASEDDHAPCHYQCSFGIAQNVDGWVDGDQTFTTGHGQSFLVVSGPERRCFWFLFNRLSQVHYGTNIPSYSRDDEAAFVDKYAELRVTEKLTFGQIYAKRLSSTLTPIHEYLYKKWYFKRMILIGDSAHKINPIGGMGGNTAIESAAEFVNALVSAKEILPSGIHNLTTEDIERIAAEMQAVQHHRAKAMIMASHGMQSLLAFEKPLLSTLALHVFLPLMGEEQSLQRMGSHLLGSPRLRKLPLPPRPRAIPFDHELPAKPLKRRLTLIMKGILTILMIITFIIAMHGRQSHLTSTTTPSWDLRDGTQQGKMPFRATVTSHAEKVSVDYQYLKVHLIYRMLQLLSPLLVYTIEGYRVGNSGTILSLPCAFTAFIYLYGIDTIAPIYTMLSAIQSSQNPAGRFVPPALIKVLAMTLTIGYLLPIVATTAMFKDTKNPTHVTLLYQNTPLMFSSCIFLLYLGSKWLSHQYLQGTTNSKQKSTEEERHQYSRRLSTRYANEDLPSLQLLYGFAFVLQSITHTIFVGYMYYQQDLPLLQCLLIPYCPESLCSKHATHGLVAISTATTFACHSLYAIWDLRRAGYVATLEAAKAVTTVLVSHMLLGVGATLIGLWSWRENVVAGLSTTSSASSGRVGDDI